MLSREDVLIAYRLILNRDPESEASIVAHQAEPSLEQLGRRLFASDEFRRRAAMELSSPTNQKWVCTEIRHGLKLWVDLSDYGVSAGCLRDDWEAAETDFILSVLSPGDVFLDIGANIGWFTILAAHAVGPEGCVYAFEPREDRYQRLIQSISDNGFEERCCAAPIALGAVTSELPLAWIPGERNPGHSFLVPGALPEGAEQIGRVPIRPLDSLNIAPCIRIMKIDVEGAELQVLEGARSLIARDRPILLMELFPRWLHAIGATTPGAVLAALRKEGYRVFRFSDAGLGRELHVGDDGIESDGPEYFNVVAFSETDVGRFLAHRFDHRVADLERRLRMESAARVAAATNAEQAEARAVDAATRTAQAIKAAEREAATRTAQAIKAAEREAAARMAITRKAAQAEARAAAAEIKAAEAAAHLMEAVEANNQTTSTLRSELIATTSQLRAIDTSTLWRATYPLRQVGHHVPSGARRFLRRGARLIWWAVTLQLPRRIRGYLAAQAIPATAGSSAPNALPTSPTPPAPLPIAASPSFWGSAFVVSPSGGPGGQPRLSMLPAPRALIIDSRWPRPDQDSGSLDAVLQARTLRNLGYEVIFASDSEYAEDPHYRGRLQEDGIICLSPAISPSVETFLHSDGRNLELCILSRVYCGGRYLEAVRQHAPRAKIVFNMVDLHYLREEREARLAGNNVMLRRSEATRERELYIVRQVDATIVVSATERAILEHEVPGATVLEMPLGRFVRAPGDIPGFEARDGVGFVGGFEHPPNVDAVQYLLNEIWPRVLQSLPGAQLSIVGAGLPDAALTDAPLGVHYLGHLPKLDPWFDRLRLTAAPLRYGAGAKGKVASSLAAGVPCVGSSVAAEGMRLQDGLHMAVADTPEAFAAQICKVHEDPALWMRLSHGGHEKALRDLSIKASEERVAALLRALDISAPPRVLTVVGTEQ